MKRRALFAALFPSVACAVSSPPDALAVDWDRFAREMNSYIEKLNAQVNDLAQLRRALRAWRRLEIDMGWKNL